jgi:hypothetical protein
MFISQTPAAGFPLIQFNSIRYFLTPFTFKKKVQTNNDVMNKQNRVKGIYTGINTREVKKDDVLFFVYRKFSSRSLFLTSYQKRHIDRVELKIHFQESLKVVF